MTLTPCLITVLVIEPDGRKESTYPEDRWQAAQIAYLAEMIGFRKSSKQHVSLTMRMGSDAVVLEECEK